MNIPISFKGSYEIHSTVDGKKNVFKGPTRKEFDIDQLKQLKEDLKASDVFVSEKTGEVVLPGVGKSIELTHEKTGIRLKASAIMFDLIFNKDNTEPRVHRLLKEIIKQIDQMKFLL